MEAPQTNTIVFKRHGSPANRNGRLFPTAIGVCRKKLVSNKQASKIILIWAGRSIDPPGMIGIYLQIYCTIEDNLTLVRHDVNFISTLNSEVYMTGSSVPSQPQSKVKIRRIICLPQKNGKIERG